MIQKLLWLRRKILQKLVPDWFWPEQVVLDGVTIPIRKMPYSFGTKWIIRKGEYEAAERLLLQKIINKGMQVIEMGSSIGVVTAIIADKIGPTGKMVAVEASETLVRQSRIWLSKYPQLQVIQGFAFPVAKAPALRIKGFDEVKGNLGGVVAFENDNERTPDERIWDIDRICREFDLQPELLVVDIEGSESVMVNKDLNLPGSLQYILIEFHPNLMPGGVGDRHSISERLKNEGFQLKESHYSVYLFSKGNE